MAAAIVIIILILLVLVLAVYMGMLDRLHIPPRPRPGQIRVACVGDSITYGFFVRGQLWNSYPSVLQKLLGEDYCVGNFGFSNRTASTDGDYPYTAEKLYKRSLDFQPDIVLIMLGSNDSKPNNWNAESYARSMTELSCSYMALDSRPRVLLMTPPSVFHFWKKVLWTIQGDVLENEVVPICRRVAEELGLECVDVHGAFLGKKELFVDGCHPNVPGARLLAETVYQAIKEPESVS